ERRQESTALMMPYGSFVEHIATNVGDYGGKEVEWSPEEREASSLITFVKSKNKTRDKNTQGLPDDACWLVATAEAFCQRACARFTITSISGDFYAETTFTITSSLENFDPLGMGFWGVPIIAGRLMLLVSVEALREFYFYRI
ncbi:hypothetical protein ACJX0J_007119, partial [Zea mays]